MTQENDQQEIGSGAQLLPSEYMRARRPHLFSDTTWSPEAVLPRDVFGYHLENLTRQKKEYEFERFCRKLAEKEICRNLIPQTGPTGGGDGKVDTETYPVAESVSENWYDAEASSAGERWAFAFSAKKDWKPKCKDDIKKIQGTNRNYARIYFMTNQAVSSREQAELKDTLQKSDGVDLWICDRNWIEEKVYDNKRLGLAIETLGLKGLNQNAIEKVGPNDAEKRSDLEEIEAHLDDETYYNGVPYQKIEDALQAAILSRGLEYPRHEVEGRFSRAERFAKKYGERQQQLRVLYQRARTAFYWHDDGEGLRDLFDPIYQLATGSMSIDDIELLFNTWCALHVAGLKGLVTQEAAVKEVHISNVRAEIERHCGYPDRPNASLWAQSILLHMDQVTYPEVEFSTYLGRYKEIFENCRGLVEFPFETIAEMFEVFGEQQESTDEYEEVLNLVADIMGERDKETGTGEVYLKRGIASQRAQRHFDAIRYLGKAQFSLGKEETKDEYELALVACAESFEKIGLYWIARSYMLGAAHISAAERWRKGIFRRPLAFSALKLVWIELHLGRIWYALEWMQVTALLAKAVIHDRDQRRRFNEEWENQEFVLGHLILKSSREDLLRLGQLPGLLEKMGLPLAWHAALFALGHVDRILSDETYKAINPTGAIEDHFRKWLLHPEGRKIPSHPEYFLTTPVTMTTILLGCNISVQSEPDPVSMEVGEILLSALEGFLATSIEKDVFAQRASFTVQISKNVRSQKIDYIALEDGGPIDFTIQHPGFLKYGTLEEREAHHAWVIGSVSEIVARVVRSKDIKAFLEDLAQNELVFARAFNFENIGTAIYDTLGDSPKRSLQDFLGSTDVIELPMVRQKAWYLTVPPAEIQESPSPKGAAKTSMKVEQPATRREADLHAHRNMVISPVINGTNWSQADWLGLSFGSSPNEDTPPLLGLIFDEMKSGIAIFNEWLRIIGKEDKDEQISIAIITGISKKVPGRYRVVLTSNPESLREDGRYATFMAQIKTLDSANPGPMQAFFDAYKRQGKYLLHPIFRSQRPSAKDLLRHGAILKTKLTVIPAWQVDDSNHFFVGIQETDEVEIPAGVTDAPVLKAQQMMRKLKRQKVAASRSARQGAQSGSRPASAAGE
ncbi:MAG: hypothetical protein JWO30_4176 [Fibrobacteres bacterium]|nr:hypothetical protein [Fibrobacterota bacterium]